MLVLERAYCLKLLGLILSTECQNCLAKPRLCWMEGCSKLSGAEAGFLAEVAVSIRTWRSLPMFIAALDSFCGITVHVDLR